MIPGPHWKNDFLPLAENPFDYIAKARHEYGNLIAFTDELSVFGRINNCAGCIGAFGARNNKQILTNPNAFPAAQLRRNTDLPEKVLNLSSGLFSMHGQEHQRCRQLFAPLFSQESVREYSDAIHIACSSFLNAWVPGCSIELLGEMRRLVFWILDGVLCGKIPDQQVDFSSLTSELLRLRRASSELTDTAQANELQTAFVSTGEQIDTLLRYRIRWFRTSQYAGSMCLLVNLSRMKDENGAFRFSEDQLVAHANTFYQTGTEAMAVCLTWTLLLLSQFRTIRKQLVEEIAAESAHDVSSRPNQRKIPELLDWVVRESLRLFPPNALMLRITTKPQKLDKFHLEAHSEVLLSPFISHRDPICFPRPTEFLPERWRNLRPSPFEYLPFGAGSRSCLPSNLALSMMKTALATMFQRFDITLASDQKVDWRISVTLMPVDKVTMLINPPGISHVLNDGGKITGSILNLFSIDPGRWNTLSPRGE